MHAAVPLAARSRRRKGFIWCGWIIERDHLAPLAGRGRIALAIRVRGALRNVILCRAPPQLSPRKNGEREEFTRNTGPKSRDRFWSASPDRPPVFARRSGAWSGRLGQTRLPGSSLR